MSLTPRRRRLMSLATAATLTLGLPVAGAALVSSPAQSADPVADCGEAFPVSELAAGDDVTGLTVVKGTTPTGFTGEVLGVLEDGIAPDVDMIMIDLDMPEFASSGGVWQGMSGSPVYAQDGRLLGAVAYGLANGPSPIAGITPFEEMDDYLAAAPTPRATPRRLSTAQARTVAGRAGITTAQAAQGFRELPMPLGITGISARRLAQLQAKAPRFADKSSYVLGKATGPRAAGAETIVAGGNIASSVAYGDVSMAGVGTATSVCDGRVVGFGHPLAYLGSTTEALHPAEALYVQPDSLGAPFKVANLSAPVGTVTDDRLTGITGSFGALPASLGIVSDVTYGGRSRTGTTSVSVEDFAGEATFYQQLANLDRVIDGPSQGTEVLSWEITGTDNGTPFSLKYTDRTTSRDLSEAAYPVAILIDQLNTLDGVSVTGVRTQATVTSTLKTFELTGVQQRRGGVGGTWVTVTQKSPVVGRPGKPVALRLVLKGSAGSTTKQLSPIVLPRAAKGSLLLTARGGDQGDFFEGDVSDGSDGSDGSEDPTVATIKSGLAHQIRHDQVQVQLGTPDKLGLGDDEGEEIYLRSSRRTSFVRTQTTAPLSHVVRGFTLLPVVVG